jgi:hypothetical protein
LVFDWPVDIPRSYNESVDRKSTAPAFEVPHVENQCGLLARWAMLGVQKGAS